MKLKPSQRNQLALTLVEVLIVVTALALLALCLLPALAKARAKSSRLGCVNFLKHIGLSFRTWSGDSGDRFPMHVSVTNGGTMEWVRDGTLWPHFQVMSNELNSPLILVCPNDKSRTAATSFDKLSNSNISYFVSLDADETQPQMLLVGDNNLEVDGKPVGPGLLNLWTNSAVGWNRPRHPKGGNICFADGSVQQIDSAQLREALTRTDVATNRLAMP